jgi:hypothetical protein
VYAELPREEPSERQGTMAPNLRSSGRMSLRRTAARPSIFLLTMHTSYTACCSTFLSSKMSLGTGTVDVK